jgi:thymidylate synthase (FAD)
MLNMIIVKMIKIIKNPLKNKQILFYNRLCYKMKVKLISYSKTENDDTLQDQVSYCARVSNPANQNNTETNEKLIKYLIKNQHWSPFEMVSICLEIETTRDIARQILRHRSFSFQEFSQRYAVVEETPVPKEARFQDLKNRQSSLECFDNELTEEWKKVQASVIQASEEAYRWALQKGIAKEVARCVLPEGLTPSRMYMNGTLRSWIHYIQLRSGNGTQKEHREVALACLEAIKPIFPMIEQIL